MPSPTAIRMIDIRFRPDRGGRRSPPSQNGQADWMFDQPPTDRLAEIGTKYKDQVHINAADRHVVCAA